MELLVTRKSLKVVLQGHFSGYPSHKTYTCQKERCNIVHPDTQQNTAGVHQRTRKTQPQLYIKVMIVKAQGSRWTDHTFIRIHHNLPQVGTCIVVQNEWLTPEQVRLVFVHFSVQFLHAVTIVRCCHICSTWNYLS